MDWTSTGRSWNGIWRLIVHYGTKTTCILSHGIRIGFDSDLS